LGSKRKDGCLFGCVELAISKRWTYADVWQAIGNVGLELREIVMKSWTWLTNE
jgi:hypothetical protein